MSAEIYPNLADMKPRICDLRGPILVLGASGFVGANLVRILTTFREDVVGTSTTLSAWRLNGISDEIVHVVNVLDDAELDELLDNVRPQTIFDCIAYGGYPFETNIQRIYQTNFHFLTHLLPRLTECGITAYIHAGSSSEYGTNGAGPTEDAFTAPNSDYSVSKIAAAALIYFYGKHRNLPCANLRLYSVYGPFEDSSRLIPQVVLHGAIGRLPEFVNPDVARDFVYIADAVFSFVHAATHLKKEIWGESFNIGTGRQHTIQMVANVARELFQIQERPSFSMPERSWDVYQWFACWERAEVHLKWRPQVEFRRGVELTLDWYLGLQGKDDYAISSKKYRTAAHVPSEG